MRHRKGDKVRVIDINSPYYGKEGIVLFVGTIDFFPFWRITVRVNGGGVVEFLDDDVELVEGVKDE